MMITLERMTLDAAAYLESNAICPKHRVEHTGSLCYLLDFYAASGEVEKGRQRIKLLMDRIIESAGARVFYPGHLDPMNMSQNVIDTGAAIDAIARFMYTYRALFSAAEHSDYGGRMRDVADSYLRTAVRDKTITNQRLWGVTGLASYARYAGTHEYDTLIGASIERAFQDMTPDGFFLYMPHAKEQGNFEGYDGITAFYQSRCTAFIRYALSVTGIDPSPFEERLRKSERALLMMYRADGIKDLRLECKRWYWQSSYEVASSGFDAYALAASSEPMASAALHNVLYQVRRHFAHGMLQSHIGAPVNFQCPVFWTAHLAWLLRVKEIGDRFDAAAGLVPFAYRFEGIEVFSDTTETRRILVNGRWQARNFNEGIYDTGLLGKATWKLRAPSLPPAFLFSVRETANHTWYALRGGYVREAALRVFRFAVECCVMLLPRYSVEYGKVESMERKTDRCTVTIRPATKYGTLHRATVSVDLLV